MRPEIVHEKVQGALSQFQHITSEQNKICQNRNDYETFLAK